MEKITSHAENDDDFRTMVKSDGTVAAFWIDAENMQHDFQCPAHVAMSIGKELIRAAQASQLGLTYDDARNFHNG